jgi:hypothetical protein
LFIPTFSREFEFAFNRTKITDTIRKDLNINSWFYSVLETVDFLYVFRLKAEGTVDDVNKN